MTDWQTLDQAVEDVCIAADERDRVALLRATRSLLAACTRQCAPSEVVGDD